ncbi:exocyst complex protein [Dacryopinax primogenitus]|uniref:Exocyst complex protein n=1 Tax=Dacryopinax primogenitus (strain DJM 731) TaxID=1858805 RepID=M5GBG4_DACPD|nr:exocyst complex protein [Dacryopinax primogenitus]EJU06294.1 exocyst complex protein [Dacryopinax primogenitus]
MAVNRSNSLFATDQAVDELLQLKTFEDRFDVREFVSSISERLIAHSKEDAGPFDPKPFIRTFESSVDRLLSIRRDLQKQTEVMENSVRNAERDYSKRMSELNSGFESVGKSFSSMETKIGEVGRTAIRIGEQLENIHQSRQRAQAAYDLIDYYNQFAKGDVTRLEALRKERGKEREGREKVAIICRRLSALAKEVDVIGAEKTRENIERYCEKFEKDILRLFDRSYRKGEPKMMAHCAQILLDFNGGNSCIQIYVNQHEFFISAASVEPSSLETEEIWKSISSPTPPPPRTEPSLSLLLQKIRSTVTEEAQIVQAVFPNPMQVLQVFIQRVFAQLIQRQVEMLLEQASNLSSLAFLRMLHLCHAQISRLVDDLKGYDFSSPTSILGKASLGAIPSGPGNLSGVLETAMEELFIPYTEGTRWLDRECKSLAELYAGFLLRFSRYHAQAHQTTKTDGLMNRFMSQISTSTSNVTSNMANAVQGNATTAQAAAAFMKVTGLGTAGGSQLDKRQSDVVVEEPLRELDGKLTIGAAETMLKWHAEAVGRCVELSPSGDVGKNAFALLRLISETLGRSYIETAIDSAIYKLESRDPKLEPELTPLHVVKTIDFVCHLWQQYVNTAILPLAGSSVTVRREMVVYNNSVMNRVETSMDTLVQKAIDVVLAWLAAQLAKQKRNDFRPRNDDMTFARASTEPCTACCDLLVRLKDASKESLTGKNQETFLTEIGVSFQSMLLEHLKKFSVSALGGLMLTKDLAMYQDAMSKYSIPIINERFEFIRQLGNLFVVQPTTLKSYISDSILNRVDPILLRPYLAQRSDWAQISAGWEGIIPNSAASTEDGFLNTTQNLRERLGAGLGSIMRELENFRNGGDEDFYSPPPTSAVFAQSRTSYPVPSPSIGTLIRG